MNHNLAEDTEWVTKPSGAYPFLHQQNPNKDTSLYETLKNKT